MAFPKGNIATSPLVRDSIIDPKRALFNVLTSLWLKPAMGKPSKRLGIKLPIVTESFSLPSRMSV
jgi:hypothetical protein